MMMAWVSCLFYYYLIFLKFQRRCALLLVFLSDEHLSGL